jgi:hypothetical protein
MAGTHQSTRNSSPPAAIPTNGTKRKADDASPTSNRQKQQKTLEEVIPNASKREEVKAALANEAETNKTENGAENGAENGDGKHDTNGGAGMFDSR